GRGMEGGRYVVEPSLERTARQCEHLEAQFLTLAHVGSFALSHEGRQPYAREITNYVHGVGCPAVDELARADFPLHDRAANRRVDRRVGTDLPCFLEGLDLLFRPAADSNPVVSGAARVLWDGEHHLSRGGISLGEL